jgi:bifunctional enzyme CysN/CysC
VPDNIVVDTSSRASLARAVLIEGYRIVAGGQVREAFDAQALKPRNRAIFLQGEQARALVPVSFAVSQEEWAQRNGHRAGVVLLTGLSGSGKSTLTLGAQRALFQRGWHVCVLDGDNLRAGLNADLSFSPEDRRRNVVRVAHVAHQIAQNGLLVLVSLIAPYAADRAEARRIIGAGFTEVYVQADLATCQLRDPKGFYAKALQGDIQGFTGVDALYEAPQAPDLTLNTATQSADESIAALVQALFVSYGLPDQSDAVL